MISGGEMRLPAPEGSHRQGMIGAVLAVLIIVAYLAWLYWGRTKLVAAGLALLVAGLSVLQWPSIALFVPLFGITADLPSLLPHSTSLFYLLGLVVALGSKLLSGNIRFVIPPFLRWQLVLMGWLAFTWLWSGAPFYRTIYLAALSFPLMIALPQLIRDRRSLEVVVWAIGLGVLFTTISSVVGALEFFRTGIAIAAVESGRASETFRFYGHWGGPNTLAHTLMPLIPFIFPLMRRDDTKYRRVFFLTVLLGAVASISLTLSRAAILGLVAGLVITIWFSQRRVLLGGVLLTVATTAMLLLPVDLFSRVEALFARQSDASVNARYVHVVGGIKMIESGFPIGLGYGSYPIEQKDYIPHTYEVYHVHNTALQLLTDGGLPAFLLFAGAMLSLVHHLKRLPQIGSRFDFIHQYRYACIGAFVSMLVALPFEVMTFYPAYCISWTLISLYPVLCDAEQVASVSGPA